MDKGKQGDSSGDDNTVPRQIFDVRGVSDNAAVTESKAVGLLDKRRIVSNNIFQTNIWQTPASTSDATAPAHGTEPKFQQKCQRCNYTSKKSLRSCPQCTVSAVDDPRWDIKCPGKKKPCGAILSLNKKYCPQCGWLIDKTLFNTDRGICKGTKRDGSICNADVQEGDRFCRKCRQPWPEDSSSVIHMCSGNTRDGNCSHESQYPFDTCPQCSSRSKPRRKEVKCPGEKHPCGAVLAIEDDFCPQCGWEVRKELFSSRGKCTGLNEDGSPCLAEIVDGDGFCSQCGNVVSEASPARWSMKRIPEQRFDIQNPAKSRWTLSNVKIGYYFMALLLAGCHAPIVRLFMAIYNKYMAVLDEVRDGSLVFIFLHENYEDAHRMEEDKETVQNYIEDFLKELDASVICEKLDISVKIQSTQIKHNQPQRKKVQKEETYISDTDDDLSAYIQNVHSSALSTSNTTRPTISDVYPLEEMYDEEKEVVDSVETTGNVTSTGRKHEKFQQKITHTSNTDDKLNVLTPVKPKLNPYEETTLSQSSKKVSRSPETSQVSVAEDTVSIIDSEGRVLEPGDAVWTEMFDFRSYAVYVGHQHIVKCQRPDMRVVKEKLDLTQPFGKLRVVSEGDVRASPRGEVIRRAKSRVGTVFTEGDSVFGSDFPVWAMCGMGGFQAWRRGFDLDWD